ncbi:DEAD/DEAH box helicase [Rhodalgimonas zhirmunskyi]|uniref:DEAD/DEAH box helicase n=1 Tax=Rhodalgimonas zhirmunskyi TaxID=2964767 RepID=A0AAJ1U5R8_9RHOB|nr:DEAD/DEAH box helicase [Rhodoalgimonas zhirmunskyi]MDQ2094111.1 DEAD/DEAH box helicase [Rhodoalgimonas zhirmunskyi]
MKQTISDALEARGYTDLTPVQQAVTNPDYDGADLLVSAQTGSGKTVGFGLAIAPTLLGEGDTFAAAGAPLALIIAPTRELALQVKRELAWLYGKAGAVLASCVGGMDMRDERRALTRGAHIVVATPGRLRDHVMRGSIDLSALRAVVLDEADEMLDLGFREDLEFILGETPEERRTLLFSATVPRGIANLAKSYQRDAIRVTTLAEASQHTDIDYHAMNVAQHDVENAVINVLRYHEAPNALVFANTRAMVARMTTRLSNRGFSVVSLSGELSQAERSHALQAMRDGRARVCVATDVAARGIDLPKLDLVVHAELPTNFETLLHRSGRTGRAGRKGVSALIVPPKSRRKAERLLQMAKLTAEWQAAPSAEAVNERDAERMLADPSWSEPLTTSEEPRVQALMEQFTPEQLAAAYLRLYSMRQSAPEDLSPPDMKATKSPRREFGATVWFSVAGGRDQGAEPRRLLPMICKAGDITRDDIGAIRMDKDESYFEIRVEAEDGFLAALGDGMKIEGNRSVTRLDKAPDIASRPAPPRGKPGQGKPAYGKPAYGKPDRGDAGPARKRPESRPDSRPDTRPENRPESRPEPRPERAAASDKPRSPRPESPSSAPIDWNDTSTPKPRKPKPGDRKQRHKPDAKPATDGAVSEYKRKPAGKPSGKPVGKPGGKPAGKFAGKPKSASGEGPSKPRGKGPGAGPNKGPGKGSKPPAGKPSSKKNRARQAAAAQIKAGKGGDAKPRRKT